MNDTPVESLTPPRRPRGGFRAALVGGLAVHLVAALVFLLLAVRWMNSLGTGCPV